MAPSATTTRLLRAARRVAEVLGWVC
jgi:hypothetical protein